MAFLIVTWLMPAMVSERHGSYRSEASTGVAPGVVESASPLTGQPEPAPETATGGHGFAAPGRRMPRLLARLGLLGQRAAVDEVGDGGCGVLLQDGDDVGVDVQGHGHRG